MTLTLINPEELNTARAAPGGEMARVTNFVTPVMQLVVDDEPAVIGARERLIAAYAAVAASHARFSPSDDGDWFAEVVGLKGVWADGATQIEAQRALEPVIYSWVLLKLNRGRAIPPMEGLDLNGL